MASSDHNESAQTIAICQFCEKSTQVKWNCINCELFLCQPCNNRIHSKSKSSLTHRIISLTDCGTEEANETIRRADLLDIVCVEHNDRKCDLFCNKCDRPACSVCVIKEHKIHELTAIEDVYETRLKEMKSLKKEIKSDLEFWKKEDVKLKSHLNDGNIDYDKKKENILQQRQKLELAIQQYTEKLLQKGDMEWKPNAEDIGKKLTMITAYREELERKMHYILQILNSKKALPIMTEVSLVKKNLLSKVEHQGMGKHSKFIIGKINDYEIGKMIGNLYPKGFSKFEVLNSYDLKSLNCNKLLSSDYDSVLFSTIKSVKKLRVADGQIIEQDLIPKSRSELVDFAIFKNGDIVLSMGKECLSIYTTYRKVVKDLQSFPSLKTSGVHVNNHQELIVGLTDGSEGEIAVLLQDGKILKTYKLETDNKRICKDPKRIVSTTENCICFVDNQDTEGRGRLLALDEAGNIKWIYSGHDDCDTKSISFTPTDIAVTQHGLILVSDLLNHAIHAVNIFGEVVACKSLLDLGISLPLSMDIDIRGNLWLVTVSPYAKHKILELKIS